MTDACKISTGPEKQLANLLAHVEATLLAAVEAALRDAHEAVVQGFEASSLGEQPPPYEHFAFAMQQSMYCLVCGADPKTLRGGRPDIAVHVIRNCQNIARHHWDADIEPYPDDR